ncbi:glycosyltransferase [Novosphingobium sp. 1949]|uniref:Glycosyltransferase n=1 Tax=Novosphingobium organovorum TaxID=2930092 RepID=A0ABT0BHQ6_9SPHN|nr:glycosyltransferase [Novosphingobium organovorum]MCJ2184597.1 glycosyltransferase [Novosphingobium organovorum]
MDINPIPFRPVAAATMPALASAPAPLVSVVMPVYNVERFVGEAIASVLAQSLSDFELIIVDDGSKDHSIAICKSFDDPRIRIVGQANRGLAGARNTGIAMARGTFVALLDSDDRWDRDKLLLHVIHLNSSADVDVSYSGSRLIDENGAVLRIAMRPQLAGVSPADILMRNPVGNGSAPVLRRAALDRVAFAHPQEADRRCWFDESFRQSEDIEMWLRMALRHDCRFEGIAGLLTDYRIVGGGLSARIPQQYEAWSRAMSGLYGDAPGFMDRYLPKARAFQLRYLSRRAVQLGDGAFALALLADALRSAPVMAFKEPGKTLQTLAGALATRLLPDALMRRVRTAFTGQGAVA